MRMWVPAALRSMLPVLAAALLLLLGPAPARAACDLEDAFDAVTQTVETTAICQPICSESKYKCYGAAGLAIILTEVSRRKGQDKVDSFCGTIQGLIRNVADNAEAVQKILELLEQLGLSSGQSQTFASTVAYAGDALAIVNCACQTEILQLKNEHSFGACLNDVLEEIGCGNIDFTTATIGKCDPVGGFIGGLVNDALNEIMELGCDIELWECGEHVPEPNYRICDRGFQSDWYGNCLPCESIPHAVTNSRGECGCGSLYTPQGFWLSVGQSTSKFFILQSCSCNAPLQVDIAGNCLCEFGKVFENGECKACGPNNKYVPFGVNGLPNCSAQCPIGSQQDKNDPSRCVSTFATCDTAKGEVLDPQTNGKTCKRCGPDQRVALIDPIYRYQCEDCPANTNPSADHLSCVPGCEPGEILGGLSFGKDPANDPNANLCQACPANSFATYSSEGYSKGSCEECPAGTYSAAGATSCLPLDCGPGSYPDPDDAHACKSCPPTQIYIPTEKKIVKGPDGKSSAQVVPGHCGCGENQVLKGGTCACAAGAIKIPLPQAGSGLFACACPEGATFDAKSATCVPGGKKTITPKRCRAGEVLNSKGVCVKRIEKPKPDTKTRTKPKPVTPDTGKTKTVPPAVITPRETLTCPPGFMPGPLGKRCIRIVPKDLVAPKLRTPPPLVCPRGQRPDETGRRCVPAR